LQAAQRGARSALKSWSWSSPLHRLCHFKPKFKCCNFNVLKAVPQGCPWAYRPLMQQSDQFLCNAIYSADRQVCQRRFLNGSKPVILFMIEKPTNALNHFCAVVDDKLTDRSRRPSRYASQLPPQLEAQIVGLKIAKPHLRYQSDNENGQTATRS